MENLRAFFTRLFLALLVAAGLSATAHAQKRVALVIGNSAYEEISSLQNPKNDASLMADTLRGLGFTLIGGNAQFDLSKAAFDRAVQRFGSQLSGADVSLFYYAGHGLQIRNSNYLVPVDANPTKEADVDFQMVDTAVVLRQMEGSGVKLNLMILDACRNNPFGGRGLRGISRGLAQMQAPEGTLISYATQPGNVALDGSDGNSPFTKALAATVRKAGLDIFQTFNEVGLIVKRSTGGAQQPWVSSSPIDGNFYFTAPPNDPAASAAPLDQAERAWNVTKDTTSQAVLEDFIRQFVGTVYASMARARLEELRSGRIAVVAPPIAPAESSGPGQKSDVPGGISEAEPIFLAQYGDWGIYAAAPKGSKICFTLAMSSVLKANPADGMRGPNYAMVTSRPAERVVNEVSIITDYQVIRGAGATLEVGGKSFAMYGEDNGFWIKNQVEEVRLIDSMRRGSELAMKGRTAGGAQKEDVYSLKGFRQALDRVARECP